MTEVEIKDISFANDTSSSTNHFR